MPNYALNRAYTLEFSLAGGFKTTRSFRYAEEVVCVKPFVFLPYVTVRFDDNVREPGFSAELKKEVVEFRRQLPSIAAYPTVKALKAIFPRSLSKPACGWTDLRDFVRVGFSADCVVNAARPQKEHFYHAMALYTTEAFSPQDPEYFVDSVVTRRIRQRKDGSWITAEFYQARKVKRQVRQPIGYVYGKENDWFSQIDVSSLPEGHAALYDGPPKKFPLNTSRVIKQPRREELMRRYVDQKYGLKLVKDQYWLCYYPSGDAVFHPRTLIRDEEEEIPMQSKPPDPEGIEEIRARKAKAKKKNAPKPRMTEMEKKIKTLEKKFAKWQLQCRDKRNPTVQEQECSKLVRKAANQIKMQMQMFGMPVSVSLSDSTRSWSEDMWRQVKDTVTGWIGEFMQQAETMTRYVTGAASALVRSMCDFGSFAKYALFCALVVSLVSLIPSESPVVKVIAAVARLALPAFVGALVHKLLITERPIQAQAENDDEDDIANPIVINNSRIKDIMLILGIHTIFPKGAMADLFAGRIITFMRNVGESAVTCKVRTDYLDNFVKLCINYVNAILRLVADVTGMKLSQLCSGCDRDVNSFIRHASLIKKEFVARESGVDKSNIEPFIKKLRRTNIAYSVLLRKYDLVDDVKRILSSTYKLFLEEAMGRYCSAVADSGIRQQPVCVVFSGPPGVGKTTLANEFGKDVLEYISPGITTQMTPDQLKWVKGPERWCDRYLQQMWLHLDDMLACKPGLDPDTSELAFLMKAINPDPFVMPCAEADKKGKIFFTSQLVTATTNIKNLSGTQSVLNEVGALARRLHIIVRQEVNPSYLEEFTYRNPAATAGTPPEESYHLDITKVAKWQALHDGRFPSHIFRFKRVRWGVYDEKTAAAPGVGSKNGAQDVGEWFDYTELLRLTQSEIDKNAYYYESQVRNDSQKRQAAAEKSKAEAVIEEILGGSSKSIPLQSGESSSPFAPEKSVEEVKSAAEQILSNPAPASYSNAVSVAEMLRALDAYDEREDAKIVPPVGHRFNDWLCSRPGSALPFVTFKEEWTWRDVLQWVVATIVLLSGAYAVYCIVGGIVRFTRQLVLDFFGISHVTECVTTVNENIGVVNRNVILAQDKVVRKVADSKQHLTDMMVAMASDNLTTAEHYRQTHQAFLNFMAGTDKTMIHQQSRDINVEHRCISGIHHIADHVLRNTVFAMHGETIIYSGVALRNRDILFPLHGFDVLKSDTVITFKPSGNLSFTSWTATVGDILRDSVHLDGQDLILYRSRAPEQYKDIVKFFIERDDLPSVSREPLTLINRGRNVQGFTDTYHKYDAPVIPDLPLTQVNGRDIQRPICRSVYSIGVRTTPGSCGSMLIVNKPIEALRCIVGLHMAGDPNAFSGSGVSIEAIVTQEDIKQLTDRVDKLPFPEVELASFDNSQPLRSAPPIPPQSCGAIPIPLAKPGFIPLGRAPHRLSVNPFNNIEETRIAPMLSTGVWAKREPRAKSIVGTIRRGGETINPMNNALAKFSDAPFLLPEADYAKAVEVALKPMRELNIGVMEPVDFETAVAGEPGNDSFCGLKRGTSAGYPFSLVGGGGKTAYFGKVGDYDFTSDFCKMLRETVEEMIKDARVGKRQAIYFTDMLKAEMLKLQKVQEGKTRLISASPLHYTIAFRMIFGRFTSAIQSCRVRNGIALGINYYTEWETLSHYLRRWAGDGEPCVFAGDYSGFDASQHPTILKLIGEEISTFYPDRENDLLRATLWQEVYASRHINNHFEQDKEAWLYEWRKSLPSGHPGTTVINSIYNLTLLVLCFHDATGMPMDHFWDFVAPIVYGDDNIVAPHPAIRHLFNQHTITALMARYGMKYTDELKGESSTSPPLRHLHEVTFLQRGFKTVRGRVVAPLNIDSIMWSVLTCVKTRTPWRVVLKQQVAAARREFALWGEEVFNTYVPALNAAYDRAMGGATDKDHASWVAQFEAAMNTAPLW